MVGWYFVDSEGVQINYPQDGVWPETYLDYAKDDFAAFEVEKSNRCLINAVSNAKRALHYQVDGLANALGWSALKGRRDFPTKLDFLGRCGVLSPIIIKRINKLRNVVEHEYHVPTEDETLEYLEIVELYLGATRTASVYFPSKITVYLMDEVDGEYKAEWGLPRSINIDIREEGRIVIVGSGETIVDFSIKDEEYYDWVSAVMRQGSY
ncbi:hypothetical protein [Pseudomonas sp. PDM19]|uniref:hypothetical protein n=1 Tax=Pseudomonas sp. PDM19 TaxID=2769272 RepID=UPI001787362C|nr:hypothetical protein [Pseudomonas sp. PDM19]MBD9631405.1 hypothetical protein [Pseudomonas sp. PDM19]